MSMPWIDKWAAENGPAIRARMNDPHCGHLRQWGLPCPVPDCYAVEPGAMVVRASVDSPRQVYTDIRPPPASVPLRWERWERAKMRDGSHEWWMWRELRDVPRKVNA